VEGIQLRADRFPARSLEQAAEFDRESDKMKIDNQQTKHKLIQRLRRIEGQLRGVQGMLDEERDCREIMQQLSAVTSALKSTSRTFFQDYAILCLTDMDQSSPEQGQALLQEMVELLDKTP
jgi:CsoR family transcriptional regulator, copper-sensing transcriptional repressor